MYGPEPGRAERACHVCVPLRKLSSDPHSFRSAVQRGSNLRHRILHHRMGTGSTG